ncbi:mucin-5AC-like [Actinia tenebrosa]|uniref:Mucin-5AC-like n=1 Tax=Actinia tenebrosa TaxID=6105 RepID=A0A6P8HTJ9_ACTTE|nr:mucin-5AC-like [Actinia tenebrosa]
MHLKTSNSTGNRARPVTVNFPLPRKAVSKLRALAIAKDPRLLDLGVLAVQITDDESIVLGIELDKTKKKSAVYVNKAASPSYAHSSVNRVSFNPKTVDPRSFTTTTTFDPFTHSYSGANASQLSQAARNVSFVSKTKKLAQNSAAKKRAKDTLNAARRGRGRGRAGKTIGQTKTSIRASTWEMVYSHIGLPREHRNEATNLLEPPVGSQASGIANVPVAQTELPKENILKLDRKRKSSVSSPPLKSSLKSPGQSGVYSEDDSSVSSSPCSHSPMNSEELMNLFVDSNFSATSVLKQLAESRSKGDEKQTDKENNNDKTNNSFVNAAAESNVKKKESGSSMVDVTVFDSSTQMGTFPKNSGTPISNVGNNSYVSDTKTSKPFTGVGKNLAVSSLFGVGPSGSSLNFSSSSLSSISSVKTSSGSGKRPANTLGDSYSGLSHPSSKYSLSSSELTFHDPQSKRARLELSIKRENLNKANEQNRQKSPDCPSSQSPKPPVISVSSPSNSHSSDILTTATKAAATTTTASNVALKNYMQYGYYYSSEDLSRALAKNGSSKSKNTPQTSLYMSASSINTPIMSISSNIHAMPKPQTQNKQPTSKEPASEVLSNSCTWQQSVDPSHKTNDHPNSESISKTSDSSKMAIRPQSSTDFHEIASSSSIEKSTSEKSQCEASALSFTTSTSGATTTTITTSSPTVLTSSDATPLRGTVPDSSSNIQSNGKCYAISYVYPMGTVWYPYVAITPYAVLQKNARKSSGLERCENETEGTSGACDTSSQYIDLASSLRYWQQLSLLYKNQMLVTASANPNILSSTPLTLGQNALGVSSSMASEVPAVLSQQTSMIDSKSERASFSFSSSELSSDITSAFSKQPGQDGSSNSSGPLEKKPLRRASVIVAAKTSNAVSSSRANSEESFENRFSVSTPESDVSSDGTQIKSEPLVIDNCNRLIEEHCQRMNEVLAATRGDYSNNLAASPTPPLLSFIPDSSIAYVNVGNNGSKKTAGNWKDGKSKSSKKKKSNKAL